MHGHLVHIGFPKAGSTFLQQWFKQHPQLFYAPGGLGGFYNVYEISRKASQHSGEDFKYHVTSDESLSIPSPSTGTLPIEFGKKNTPLFKPDRSAQKTVCSTLKCLYPNAKILFITRGYKGIIMSSFSQYVRVGGIRVFEEFAGTRSAAMYNQEDRQNEGGGLDFTFIANMYEEAFGKENMIILPFELLRDDQDKFLSVIEARLGLSHFEATTDRQNESLSAEELYWYPRLSSVVSGLSQRCGQKVYGKVYRWWVGKTLTNKFRKAIKILSWLKPGLRVTNADFIPGIWDYFRKNYGEKFVAKFQNDANYTPYLPEYLIEGETNRN